VTREEQVRRVVNEIVDPCSVAAGTPAGLVDMGIVESVDVTGSTVRVRLLPTSPACLVIGALGAEIEARVGALDWCSGAVAELADGDLVWDEERLAPAVRERLLERRAAVRRR
jgi:metal-sulfur cluster biosynthetic enzyme